MVGFGWQESTLASPPEVVHFEPNAEAASRNLHVAEANQDTKLSMNKAVCPLLLKSRSAPSRRGSGNELTCQVQGLLFAFRASLAGQFSDQGCKEWRACQEFRGLPNSRPNPSVNRTSNSGLRPLSAAGYLKR